MTDTMTEYRKDGYVVAIAGVSGSGKSSLIESMLKPFSRAVVYDVKHEYQGDIVANSITELRDAFLQHERGKARIIARLPREEIERFARLAFTWCKMAPCAIVFEETGAYSSAGKAPPGMYDVVTQIRAFGGVCFTVTQIPSRSERDSWDNARYKICLMLDTDANKKHMESLGVPQSRIPTRKYRYYMQERGAEQGKELDTPRR